MEPKELKAYLYHQIPVTESLGIQVDQSEKDKVQLSAPLALNYNHKKTAFGGSLSVIGILSGWSLVYLRLLEQKNEIVIQDSSMSYLKPVKEDFVSICEYQTSKEWELFFKAFDRRGKGRIQVESNIFSQGELVAKHSGHYVALKTD